MRHLDARLRDAAAQERLTGEFAMDMQEASGTLLLDVAHRRWSTEVAEAAGIPVAWLPRLFEGPEICARISTTGSYPSPRGCTGTMLSVGTADRTSIDADFSGVDCPSLAQSTFRGHVVLSKAGS